MIQLTKQNEIDTYRAFVASQPRGSYLASILAGSEAYIESEIRNDFARPLAGELRELPTRSPRSIPAASGPSIADFARFAA